MDGVTASRGGGLRPAALSGALMQRLGVETSCQNFNLGELHVEV